jgi:hypothetical protein
MTSNVVLIGSRAFAVHEVRARCRIDSDWDVLMTSEVLSKYMPFFTTWSVQSENGLMAYIGTTKLEIHVVAADHPLLKWAAHGSMLRLTLPGTSLTAFVAPLHALFSLKAAHIYQPIHWAKSIADYHILKKVISMAAWITDSYAQELYASESSRVLQRANARIKLSVDKKTFFETYHIPRIIEHDVVHEHVKHTAEPMYLRYLKEGHEVLCDEQLWNALTHQERCFGVQEEAQVIALERILLPALERSEPLMDATQSYRWALMRICTTLTKGWFRTFSVEHYPELQTPTHDLHVVATQLYEQRVSTDCLRTILT